MPTCRRRASGTRGARGSRALRGLVVALAVLCSIGCRGCQKESALAKLEQKSGEVVRDYEKTQQAWVAAAVGSEFFVGDAIQTKKDAGAELALDDGSRLRMEAETRIRFMDKKPGSDEQSVDLQTGTAVLDASAQATAIRTSVGLARLNQGGRLVISRGEQALVYKVLVGQAHLESTSGAQLEVGEGQEVSISLGTAEIELSADAAATPAAPAAVSPEPDGPAQAMPRAGGLPYADLEIAVGQKLVVHDPSPPTAVRFLFGELCKKGEIRLVGSAGAIVGDAAARGEGSVSLPLGPGKIDYALRCTLEADKAGPKVGGGTIHVLADAGTKPVPLKAPATFVDINGRSYNVLYQNQLPEVTVRWSSAPADASGFKLHVSSAGRRRMLTTPRPSYTFASGVFGEGTHELYFEGGNRVSRRTSVTITFDNATPTAALQTPASTGVGPGGSVHLAGGVLPGWSVTVDGRVAGLDADGRFSLNANMPSDGRPLAVRLTHPTRGTHVYLRRPAGGR